MRDYRLEIDETEDIHHLRSLLGELGEEIERLLALSYEGDAAEQHAHNLELVRQYGEHKLSRLLE